MKDNKLKSRHNIPLVNETVRFYKESGEDERYTFEKYFEAFKW